MFNPNQVTTLLDLMGCEPTPRRLPVEPIARHADLSDDHQYRWTLQRRWGAGPSVCWFMLNPSVADERRDDPTLRRVMRFTDAWGYRSAVVVNLYPYRSSLPSSMMAWRAGNGIEPDWALAENRRRASLVLAPCELMIAAYGVLEGRQIDDLKLWIGSIAPKRKWRCLGTTAEGWPKHPMARGQHWVPDGTEAQPYDPLRPEVPA